MSCSDYFQKIVEKRIGKAGYIVVSMEDLNIKITNYMTHFRSNNYREIIDIIKPTDDIYKLTIEQLAAAEEELFNYKMSVCNPLFTFINNTKNNPLKMNYLKDQLDSVSGALLVIFIQRQCTAGKIEISDEYNYKDTENEEKKICESIDDIMTQINKSVVVDSAYNKNKYIKNILHYVQELEEIRKSFVILLSNVPDNEKEAYTGNFARIKGKIENKIKKNYWNFRKLDNDSLERRNKTLDSVSPRKVTPILNVQLEILIKIYITFCFALEQESGMNKIIFPLIVEQKNMISLLKKEEIAYKSLFSKEDPEEQAKLIKWIKKILYKEVLLYFRKNIDRQV